MDDVRIPVGEVWRAPLLWRVLMVAARVLCVLVGRLRVEGSLPAHLRGTPVLVACNHVGAFDPIVLVAALHRLGMAPRLLAAAGLFRAPVIGAVLRACGHIPVNRRAATAADALHEAQAALAAGATVAMYPEGRIGLDPGLWPEKGKTGLARLALQTGATVLPVAQWGAHEVVAYSGAPAMLRSFLLALVRRPVLRVRLGDPVDLSDLHLGEPGTALRATERVMRALTVTLRPLRTDEPGVPRHLDVTRPVSSERSRSRTEGADPAGMPAVTAAPADGAG